MTSPSLSRLAVQTVTNYRVAASEVVAASGAGTRRFVKAVDGALHTQVLAPAAKLAPKPVRRVDQLRGTASRQMVKSIGQIEKAAEASIARSSDFAVAQVARLADMAAGAKPAVLANGLHTAARLSIPAAQLALKVSGTVAAGATTLAGAAGAKAPLRRTVRKAAARRAKAPAAKRARRAAQPAAAA